MSRTGEPQPPGAPLHATLLLTVLAAACSGPSQVRVAEHVPADTAAVVKGVSLSAATEGEFDPRKVGTTFTTGTQAVSARYRYAGAETGTGIELLWTLGGQLIHRQAETLERSAGTSSWTLKMGTTSPLPSGSYALEIVENGRSVIRVPFTVGEAAMGTASNEEAAREPVRDGSVGLDDAGTGSDTAGDLNLRQPDAVQDARVTRRGDAPGEEVRGLHYTNPAAGLELAVPSYAWSFDPVSRRQPENTVVAGRFAPDGRPLAILRVRVQEGAGSLESWAAAQQKSAPATRQVLKSDRREIDGGSFVQVSAREPGARVLAAYAVQGGRGFAFEFRTDDRTYEALEDEFQQILASARFR